MDMGKLIPLTWYEALPGDTIQQRTSALIRVSPLNAPVMHPCLVRIHNFFVPYRLIWDDWEDFITGGQDGNDDSIPPVISTDEVTEGSLHDYMGVPPASYSPNLEFSALPFRAYNVIFNEHYRDQDLVDELVIDKTDGIDNTTETDIQNVAWPKDYFTTARGSTSRGDAITIPIGESAPLVSDAAFDGGKDADNWIQVRDSSGNLKRLFTDSSYLHGVNSTDGTKELKADLSSATGLDVNDLRLALGLQRYQEARQQYGARYTEYLRYLGVRSSDARLQIPEFLSGGRNTLQFSEVLAHDGSNTGDLYGHGIGALRSNRFRRFFEEHGLVMTLMSVVPKPIYTQGLHKKWSRQVKEDYFQKELQFIGEDEVYNKEVYTEHTSPDGVFGYQARYDEYRSHPSHIAGEFHNSLNHWHLARQFTGDPALNQSFTDCVPTKRILQATGSDALYVMANHSIQARRMMSKRAYNKIL